jgi:hypothetical protein
MVTIVQVAVSVVVVASVMPVVLLTLPSAREGRLGLASAGVMLGVAFVLIRLVWPRRRA